MAIREDLITQITTNIASQGKFSVSSELPFDASGQPLYAKNKRTVYVSDEDENKVQLYRTLDQGEVYQTETTVFAYFTDDAKNLNPQTPTVIQSILDAKSVVSDNVQLNECLVSTEIEDDTITYTFEYNFTTV